MLLNHDRAKAVQELHALSVRDLTAYAKAVGDTLATNRGDLARAGNLLASGIDARSLRTLFEMLPLLFEATALEEAIDLEFGNWGVPGRHFIEGWVDVPTAPRRGATSIMRERLLNQNRPTAVPEFQNLGMRAVPTRQLHITAGNSPLIPVLSFLRALPSKGASVIKTPAEAIIIGSLLAIALHLTDPDHPITRNTSILYWPGGDPAMEDVLFKSGNFDRIVVWGSRETISRIARRAPLTKMVLMVPRYGVSLIGREALSHGKALLNDAVLRATSDAMIGGQQACISSLVHYVEADEPGAVRYCQALCKALANWDRALPHQPSPEIQGALHKLRRGAMADGRWFLNGRPGSISSAVVYMPTSFDLAIHPASRLIVVRRVGDLKEALKFLNPSVSTVGVYPEGRRHLLRDAIAVAGVSNIFPLGEHELAYAGMPHDGMKVLSELVDWTSG
jgi:hypothetical protein